MIGKYTVKQINIKEVSASHYMTNAHGQSKFISTDQQKPNFLPTKDLIQVQ